MVNISIRHLGMEYFLIITLGDTGNGFKGIECSCPLEIKKKKSRPIYCRNVFNELFPGWIGLHQMSIWLLSSSNRWKWPFIILLHWVGSAYLICYTVQQTKPKLSPFLFNERCEHLYCGILHSHLLIELCDTTKGVIEIIMVSWCRCWHFS